MGNHVLGIATQVIVMAIVISIILLFLGIGILVLIHVCIVGRTLRRGLSDMTVNIVDRGSLGSTSMSQDDIEKLPCFDFKAKEKGTSPAAVCAVCLENFKGGEKCRLLPSCNHSFHAECVDLWLLRAAICPICRSGAELMDSESIYGEESNRFGEQIITTDAEGQENSGLNEVVVVQIDGVRAEERNINSNAGEEIVDSSGDCDIPDTKQEGMVGNQETVIEVREGRDNMVKTGNLSEVVDDVGK